MVPYKFPKYRDSAFNCPHCGVYSNQKWSFTCCFDGKTHSGLIDIIEIAECPYCDEYSLWYKKRMVYPYSKNALLPNPDMPLDVKSDFEEAHSILSLSPRGASALLRLAIQKLCKYLGENGKDLNKDIGELVKKGLPCRIQQALDIVRVIGNNAVHPGQIDLDDDAETAEKLFGLVNLIADVMISQPKTIDKLYEKIPPGQKEAIENRDKVAK
ncbi:MAG TPA: DUF4145 domain-containing protein [Bacillota bacterium]|nr:DUF4145 domain-containing protein [Bacillota bacterium]